MCPARRKNSKKEGLGWWGGLVTSKADPLLEWDLRLLLHPHAINITKTLQTSSLVSQGNWPCQIILGCPATKGRMECYLLSP